MLKSEPSFCPFRRGTGVPHSIPDRPPAGPITDRFQTTHPQTRERKGSKHHEDHVEGYAIAGSGQRQSLTHRRIGRWVYPPHSFTLANDLRYAPPSKCGFYRHSKSPSSCETSRVINSRPACLTSISAGRHHAAGVARTLPSAVAPGSWVPDCGARRRTSLARPTSVDLAFRASPRLPDSGDRCRLRGHSPAAVVARIECGPTVAGVGDRESWPGTHLAR